MRRLLLLCFALSAVHCNNDIPTQTGDNQATNVTETPASASPLPTLPVRPGVTLELDPVTDPPKNVSLLLLQATADRGHLTDVIEQKLGGVVYQLQGTRLMIVSVPTNADAVLTQLGVVTRFARSVATTEIPSATTEETRFVEVFDSRYYPPSGRAAIVATRVKRAASEPREAAPRYAPVQALDGTGAIVDTQTTPFASGTIVVSIILPESNGVAEPSTEDWSEDLILQTYLKVQTALEAYTKSEPNSHQRFIVHYESAPGHGGLPGTIDSDYECGLHFGFAPNGSNQDELNVSAPMLATLLGHAVTSDQVYSASWEYLDKLRDQYHADGAFYVKVTPDSNGTAPFRAHAYINGPWNALTTDYGFNTFTHEDGHIFGALDEYCPDMCLSPSMGQGYLAMVNANAKFFLGGGGIDNGHGEDAESLMNENDADAINGYTRGAWGWIDSDGDGLFDVRDTVPLTNVTASVTGSVVSVSGTIVDRPEARTFGGDGVSFNQITSLEYRLVDGAGSDWFSVPLAAGATATATATLTNVSLGQFPGGTHTIAVRGRNSMGNAEKLGQQLTVTVAALQPNSAPRVSLAVSPTVVSTRSTITLTADAADFDTGDSVTLRFDTNGDGTYDTAWGTTKTATVKLTTPGLYHLAAQARDKRNAVTTTTADVYVLAANAPPAVAINGPASIIVGQLAPTPSFSVASSIDPDGDTVQYDWIVDGATIDNVFHTETGFAATNTSFAPSLPTPATLIETPVDLTAGNAALATRTTEQLVAVTPTLIASAGGVAGLLFTDISTPSSPVVVANLQLETSADQLLLDGTKLYVLGGSCLSVVDVSKPAAPVETKQATTISSTRVITDSTAVPIPDGSGKGAVQTTFPTFSERIASLEIDAEVDHPTPAQLTFTLQVYQDGNLQSFVLRSLVAGKGGDKTYTFTDANTPALKALVGGLAVGEWDLFVSDTVAGSTGTFKKATITWKTTSRAYATLAGTGDRLIGVLPNHDIVVGGLGLQLLDPSKPTALKQVSTITGTGTYAGVVLGNTALVLSPFTASNGKATRTHALYAVDFTAPALPVVKRQDESFGPYSGTLTLAGSRAYLYTFGSLGTTALGTHIIDVAAFAANSATYLLGTFPSEIDSIFGTNALVWGLGGGHVQGWNVTAPATPVLVHDYPRSASQSLTSLGANNVLIFDGVTTWLVNVLTTHDIISRVYRVTLQAMDSQGAITAVTRTLHVVPYDHAPTVTAAVTSGSKAGDLFEIQATIHDADFGSTWDQQFFVRADLDNDGVYETGWEGGDSTLPQAFPVTFSTPGSYPVNIEVRDMFNATSTTTLTVVVK